MNTAELFAGCGGLALGMSRAGFSHALLAEFDRDAVETARHNQALGVEHVRHWPIERVDVREIDWKRYAGDLAVISGGPPCQPFGIGGKKHGQEDPRDMWPEAIRAVRETTPNGFLFENVRNLSGPKFRDYLLWVVEHLARPELTRARGEDHFTHLARLRDLPATYDVSWQVVNAADFGAPQIRHRVLIFGIRRDLGRLSPGGMAATHSRDRLLWDQFVTGEYWERHGLRPRAQPSLKQDQSAVQRLRESGQQPVLLPWVTIRDALSGLGSPSGSAHHVFQPGARVYPGHTGSPLDLPSKALKAGDHGVPGGENMMVMDDGTVRYFTLREAARLVGLPDEFAFPRSWSESMRQLGNAVPAQLAEAAGAWLRHCLSTPAAKVLKE